jgi:PAS domain S-box-containing protein
LGSTSNRVDQMSDEVRSELILDALPDAVVAVAQDGSIIYANARLARMFGFGRDALIGRPIEVLVPDWIRDQHPKLRERYLDEPHQRPLGALELVGRRADGSEIPVDISLAVLQEGERTIVAAIVRETRDREAARRELEAVTEQLQAAQRLDSVGQLAGGIAHDFNNLLSVILNYASFAIRSLPEGDPIRADIEQVQFAGERAAALTHQLLLFSKREVARPEVIDLNTVVTELERLLRRSIGEQIRLVVSLAGNLRPVLADPHKLEQALLSLAVNARDAMPGGGTLELETANVTLDERSALQHPGSRPGEYVALTVTDDGMGMTPEVAAHAFEPFYSAKEHGSGLGLATVYGIVKQARGSVRLDTEPGKGTAVTILLPATRQVAPDRAAVTAGSSATLGGETILIVEDERAVLELTKRILTQAGYHVIAATTPEEAIEACQQTSRQIDLLLSDMVMPQISGIDLARRARDLQPNVRIAFMTGYSREFLERHAKLGDVIAIIEKPFSTDRLLSAVRSALDSMPVPLPPE